MQMIVATGAHSGLGFEALKHFFSLHGQTPARFLLGCRTPDLVSDQIEQQASPSHGYQLLPLDLRSATSVSDFATNVTKRLDLSKIDVLLLGAGILKNARDSNGQLGEDFIVNHLAQHYLLQLLRPHLASNARVVFVASALHARIKDISRLDAILKGEQTPYDSMQSYSASKFAQMLSAQYWNLELDQEVAAVSPGFVPSTSLNRELSLPKRLAMSYVMPWLPFTTSPVDGGRAIYRAMFEDLPAIDLGKLKYLNPKGELVEPHSATRDEDLIKRYCPDSKENSLQLWQASVCK